MAHTANPDQKVADSILRSHEVEHATGLSRTTIWRERMAGRFPQPVQITATLHGWRASDVNAWLERRLTVGERSDRDVAEAYATGEGCLARNWPKTKDS